MFPCLGCIININFQSGFSALQVQACLWQSHYSPPLPPALLIMADSIICYANAYCKSSKHGFVPKDKKEDYKVIIPDLLIK